jgi:hypothetical protein
MRYRVDRGKENVAETYTSEFLKELEAVVPFRRGDDQRGEFCAAAVRQENGSVLRHGRVSRSHRRGHLRNGSEFALAIGASDSQFGVACDANANEQPNLGHASI